METMKQDKIFKIMFATFILLAISMNIASSEKIPANPQITYNFTETVAPKAQAYLNTSGGSFTTLILNASQQNYKWKAYVGNATGRLQLQDQGNYSIYNWQLSTITGNIFVSRNNSLDWTTLKCANSTIMENEDSYLNINTTRLDSINMTFNTTTHKQFYAATNRINQNTCPSIATFINGSAQTNGQNNKFQEMLLQDNRGSLIYTTIIENAVLGFDNNKYDFQMIVAEDETRQTATPYYFYMELI